MTATRTDRIRALVMDGATAMDITTVQRANPTATLDSWIANLEPTGPAVTDTTDQRLLVTGDAAWPARLTNLPAKDAPWWLWVDGNQDALHRPNPAVAIVGTQSPSAGTVATVTSLAGDLAATGATIVTTLGDGVGQAVATAALDAGGIVIAITGAGVDADYPRQTAGLKDRIKVQGGCLVSEVAPRVPVVHMSQFLERNRIVAGLADVVLVAEAAARSGAINVAMWARLFDRPVRVAPFDMDARRAAGSARLVMDGTLVVDTVHDLLDALN